MRTALAGAAIVTALVLSTLGAPRLIGTGCDARPFGIALAREESDFLTRCDAIAPILE